MNVKTKLFVGFGTLMFLMFALAGIGINRLTTIDLSMKEIYSNRYMKLQLTSALRDNTTDLARVLANLLLSDDTANSLRNLEAIRTSRDKVNQSLEKIASQLGSGMEQPLAADIMKNGQKFLEYADDVGMLYRAGQKTEANRLRTDVGVDAQDQFLKSIAAMTLYQEDAMQRALKQTETENGKAYTYTAIISVITLFIGVAIMFWLVLSITRGLSLLSGVVGSFGKDHAFRPNRIPVKTTDEFGNVARTFNEIAENLEHTTANERQLSQENADQAWLQTNIARMSTELQSILRLDAMAERFIGELCRIVNAQNGALYIVEQDGLDRRYRLRGAYAHNGSEAVQEVKPGQGLIGQCALDGQPITLTDVAAEYGGIRSAFGEVAPVSLAIRPVYSMNDIIAVFEISAIKPLSELELKLIDHLSSTASVTIHRIKAQMRVEELLRISQMLTDELQSQSEELLHQQDELRASNEKLEEQTRALQSSEELLQRQQGELEQGNRELLRKTELLEMQIRETEEINRQIELARDALEKQAVELNFASKYKSEFMANMSHELRTPLNSMLILSQLLKENKDGNLSDKQVEYAETILSSGTDLLKLIDDILDLAKVESGRMNVHRERVLLKDVTDSLNKAFTPVAQKKQLEFHIQVDKGTTDILYTDSLRLLQILKNLLSNAFKFTERGGVTLRIGPLEEEPAKIAFAVKDTGIGIPAHKQQMIFEAFQQADGTTSRQYGGSGLGLSISKQMAGLLGGRIELESEPDRGSEFVLIVPQNLIPDTGAGAPEVAAAVEPSLAVLPLTAERPTKPPPSERLLSLDDDRESITANDRTLLIIEDDLHYAKILVDMARSRGFKALAALQGDTGLEMAQQYKPDAILLDIQLPVIDGWSILVHLKNEAETRHIPVHVLSVAEQVQQGLAMGAMAYLQKPSGRESLEQAFAQIEAFLDKGPRRLLLVGEDPVQRQKLMDLIGHDDIEIVDSYGGEDALKQLRGLSFDCVVIDTRPDAAAEFELLDYIKGEERLHKLPVVIYSEGPWTSQRQLRLKKYAESIIIKDVHTPERLLDETALFLHRMEEHLPEDQKQILRRLHNKEEVFAGKKVLLVDDDIRNVFALSNLLEGYDMQISFAETGKQALARLEAEPDFDLVLMDIMMPEMDGYQAMQAIRAKPEFGRLPIIALTAKAMRDDREKCIQAGASDYITKPIHTEQLLSLIRIWLCQ